jgi:hypothetical protein
LRGPLGCREFRACLGGSSEIRGKFRFINGNGAANPAKDIRRIVEEHGEASPLDGGESGEDANVGFEEIAGEAEGEIGNHENFEEIAFKMRAAGDLKNRDGEEKKKKNFVELGGMTAKTISEVDAPWQRGGDADGVIFDARKEAADTANGDTDAERKSEEIASARSDAEKTFEKFNNEEAADEGANDSFAREQNGGLREMKSRLLRIFEQEKQFGAKHRADGSSSDDPPATRIIETIASLAAQRKVSTKSNRIGKRFEKKMRMNGNGAKMKVHGKRHCC